MRPLHAGRVVTRDEAGALHALQIGLSRRELLRTGFGGVLLVAFGAVLPSGCQTYSPIARPLKFLSRKEFAVVTRAAVRILGLPDDRGDEIGGFIDNLLAELPPTTQRQARLMLRVVEHGTHLFDLKPKRFTRLSQAEQDTYLQGWMESSLGARRIVFRALKTLAALGYYAQPSSWEAIGYDGPWLGRVDVASDFTHEEPVSLAAVRARLASR